MLVQLFLESAKDFNDNRYDSAKSSGLRQLKDTFKSWVPDDYHLVRAGVLCALTQSRHRYMTAENDGFAYAYC